MSKPLTAIEIQRWRGYVEAHGGRAWYVGPDHEQTSGYLTVACDWFNVDTGERGTDYVKCYTYQDVRNVLGY